MTRVEVVDPLTGASRTLTVAGLVDQARWAGVDHVYVARSVVDELGGGSAPPRTCSTSQTAAGTNNDVVAAIVDGTHLPNGAYARSFRALAARHALGPAAVPRDRRRATRRSGLFADLRGHRRADDRPRATSGAGRSRCCARSASAVARCGARSASSPCVIAVGGNRRRSGRRARARVATRRERRARTASCRSACRWARSSRLRSRWSVASLVATSVPARRAGRLRPAGRPPTRRVDPVQISVVVSPTCSIGVVFPQTEIGADRGAIRAYARARRGARVRAPARVRPRARRRSRGAQAVARSVRRRHDVPRAVRAVRLPRRAHVARAGHRHHHPPAAPDRARRQAGGRGRPPHRRPVPARRRSRLERGGVRGARHRLLRPRPAHGRAGRADAQPVDAARR